MILYLLKVYFFSDLKEMEDKEIISGFIKQYYIDKEELSEYEFSEEYINQLPEEKIIEENLKRKDDKFIKDYSLVEKAMQKCYRYLCKLYKVKHLK